MTTVGYGDQYPITFGGGVFAVLSCFLAMVLMALTVNVVVWRLSLDPGSLKIVNFAAALKEHTNLRASAARCIQRLYFLSPVYRRLHPEAHTRAAFGPEEPRRLRRRWADIDKSGHGPLADAGLVRTLRDLREARTDEIGRVARWRGDVQNQLCEAEDRSIETELLVDEVLDKASATLHRLSAAR
ncbi:hypothetical protein T484DRAFT_3614644 [Baffinella frigidus]|nr:hypothetical protein T484DRAFT_3614644 [Cryptophyta sp. CCMP2293]